MTQPGARRQKLLTIYPVLIGLLAIGRLAYGDGTAFESESPTSVPERTLSAEASALVSGLRVGDSLGGWEVEQVFGPDDGAVEVWVKNGELRIPLRIVPIGSRPHEAPEQTDRVGIYYGSPIDDTGRGIGPPVDTIEVIDAIRALRDRIDREAPLPF
ncbi:MAG: hypothetical protein AAGF12_22370 [Myxococcota bacterium]